MPNLPIQDNESIGSYFFRNLTVAGGFDDRRILRKFLRVYSDNLYWTIFPTTFAELYDFFETLFKSKDELDFLSNHTTIDLYRPTSQSNISTEYLNTLIKPDRMYTRQHFRTCIMSKFDPYGIKVKFCPLCFEDQRVNFGFAWFKRDWQICGNNTCIEHKCLLLQTKCPNCNNENNNAHFELISALSGQCLNCGYLFETSYATEHDLHFLNWMVCALNAKLPMFSRNLAKFVVYSCISLKCSDAKETENSVFIDLILTAVRKRFCSDIIGCLPYSSRIREDSLLVSVRELFRSHAYVTPPFSSPDFFSLITDNFPTFEEFHNFLISISYTAVIDEYMDTPYSRLELRSEYEEIVSDIEFENISCVSLKIFKVNVVDSLLSTKHR